MPCLRVGLKPDLQDSVFTMQHSQLPAVRAISGREIATAAPLPRNDES